MAFNLINKRFINITCKNNPAGSGYGIKEVTLKKWKDLAKSSRLDMIHGLTGAEGIPYKVFTGRDGSYHAQPHPFSVSFMLYDNEAKRLYTPQTLPVSWRLEEGGFPVSIVNWQVEGIECAATTFSNWYNDLESLLTFCEISVKNKDELDKNLSLLVLIQKSPLSKEEIKQIRYNKNSFIMVNGEPGLFLKEEPEEIKNVRLKAKLKGRISPESKALVYNFALEAGKKRDFYFITPSHRKGKSVTLDKLENLGFKDNLKLLKEYWSKRVPLKLTLPDKRFQDCFYSSLYYMLICMDGYNLHPGPYNYTEFTLHDSVGIASALDKAGMSGVVDNALDYFHYHSGDGYLDGLGGSIFSLYEHYLLTGDKRYLKEVYPRMKEASRVIRELRKPQLSENMKGSTAYGLLPKGASQDNFKYWAHLYVDNWWAVIGLKSALESAAILDEFQDIEWIKKEYENQHKEGNEKGKSRLYAGLCRLLAKKNEKDRP